MVLKRGVLLADVLASPDYAGSCCPGSLAAHPRGGRAWHALRIPDACRVPCWHLSNRYGHWRLLCASVFSGVRVKAAAGRHALSLLPSRPR